ncbi:MAG: NAD(P)-binding domain-containing protein, partial [Actinomycetota bacterium]
MKIGLVGLGRMGGNMKERLERDGHQVIGYSRSNTQQAKDLADLVSQLPTPRVVWLMVPSGDITQMNIDEMCKLLGSGDVLIDGGNSNFRDSIRRAAEVQAQGIHWADSGTSGGIWGLTEGYSLMIGADEDTFGIIEPLAKTLAPPNGYARVGPPGAGHFVKMVHNGIEYGVMAA